MKARDGSVEQVVSRTPFPLIEAQTLNVPKPLIYMLLLVYTERRYVNQLFWVVRKLPQGVNGTRFVPGGCSGNHWQYGVSARLPVVIFHIDSISYNVPKTPEPLSDWIGENRNISTFSQNIFEKSLSLPHLRRDYFSMSIRANIRQPGKPATERHSIEAEGELYDDYGKKTQRSF